jgi:hypothetical protein
MSEDGTPPSGRSGSITATYGSFVAANAMRAMFDQKLANLPEGTDAWEQVWFDLEAVSTQMEDLITSLADQPSLSNSDLVLKARALVTVLASAIGGTTDLTENRLRLVQSVASEVIRLL